MNAHRIEAQVGQDGAIHIPAGPFKPGEQVDIIILEHSPALPLPKRHFSMRGLPHVYIDPFEPACPAEDWDVYNDQSDAP
jgi:hypothetical protein